MLGKLPHQTLTHLSKEYGPIMSIKLGSIRTIVVSSPRAAELFLKTHDHVFAGRPKTQASKILFNGSKAVVLTPYGTHWRSVRKLYAVHLLNTSKTEKLKPIRSEELGVVMDRLRSAAEKNEVVNVSKTVVELLENLVYRMIFARSKNDVDKKLKVILDDIATTTGAFNISDYFPLLAPLDLQGMARRMKRLRKSLDEIFEKIIEEHEQQDKDHVSKEHKDFVDMLLSLQNQSIDPHDENSEIIGANHIKAILLDIVGVALETSAKAIEWTFSEILRNPRVMKKLQEELENVIGKDRMVEESDLPKFTYLDMVIKEGLRLHPVGPLSVPHESREDVWVDGYYIPRKSTVLINIWSMGRDPYIWAGNTEEFYPERFENGDTEIGGLDFKFIPFGSGRRRCPGMQMAMLSLRLVLARLVHSFDWEMPEEIDMDEEHSAYVTVGRKNNVLARPIYRLNC